MHLISNSIVSLLWCVFSQTTETLLHQTVSRLVASRTIRSRFVYVSIGSKFPVNLVHLLLLIFTSSSRRCRRVVWVVA